MDIKRISISEAAPGMIVAENIFNSSSQLIVPKDTELTDKAIARMRFHSIAGFRIRVEETVEPAPEESTGSDSQSYFDKLRETPEFIAYSGHFNSTVTNMEKIYSKFLTNPADADIDSIAGATTDLRNSCRSSIQVFDLLHAFREYDDLTYAHSLNVALICAVQGEWLGLSQKNIDVLIKCGLYHDIGKLKIPKEILEKPTPLTPKEKQLVEGHVILGYNLVKNQNLDERIKQCIMMHHERCDGSGYPLHLTSEKIHEFAKIVAIADVYEAMTSPRAYRKGKCPFEVIQMFESQGLAHFDPKVLMVFMENITQSYMGTRVRLSNGVTGTIVYINKFAYSRPMIEVNESTYIDLSKEPNLTIEAMI